MADKRVIELLREVVRKIEAKTPPPSEPKPPGFKRHPEPESLDVRDGPYYRKVRATYSTKAAQLLIPSDNSCLDGLKHIEPQIGPPNRWLYLDIETTGLLGAGTLPFLVGLGEWLEADFVVTQYLLTDRDNEQQMLEELKSVFDAYNTVVTFNGKSFDIPVLQGRYVLWGLRPLEFGSHLDLLGAVRNTGTHPRYMRSLEESVKRFLGVSRTGDIPGRTIPALYFMYERQRDISILEQVLTHNRLDVLDMACLAPVLGQLFLGKEPPLSGDSFASFGAGKMHYRKKNLSLARKCLENAGAGLPDLNRETHLGLLADVMRKQGDWPGASRIWAGNIENNQATDKDYLWLARYYELVCQDFEKALEITEAGLKRYSFCKEDTPTPLVRRKKRLLQRIGARKRGAPGVI